MQNDLSQMGFGKTTGVDLPLEAKGIMPTNAYKRALEKEAPKVYGKLPWQPGDNVNMAIGQGFMTTTPIELATAYSAIANGGKLYEPRVAWKIESPDGKVVRVVRPTQDGRLPISRQEVAYLRNALTGLRRVPALHDPRRREDRHRRHRRQAAVLVVRRDGPRQQPEVRGGRHGRAGRPRRNHGGAGGPADPAGAVQPEHGTGHCGNGQVHMTARGVVS
jgi:hypothetical protein